MPVFTVTHLLSATLAYQLSASCCHGFFLMSPGTAPVRNKGTDVEESANGSASAVFGQPTKFSDMLEMNPT